MSIKTALYDPDTTEFLLLSNGEPDYTAHTLWRLGVLHIYRPGDWPNILVSVDPHGERTDWSFQTPPSRPLPPPSHWHDLSAHAADAAFSPSGLPPHPWISYDEVTYGLADTEIVPFDIWRRGDRREPHPQVWEEYDRPVLVRLPIAPLAPSHSLPPPTPSQPAPSAPPASPQPVRSAPPLPFRQPDLSAPAAGAAIAPSSRLPIHIQRLVIDAAINTRATCPITMEPITADTAVITPCGHVFGTELTPRVSLCPICRSCL